MSVTEAQLKIIADDKSLPGFRTAIANVNALSEATTKSHRRIASESTTAFEKVEHGIEKAHHALESFGALIGVSLGAEVLREGVRNFAQVDTSIRQLGFSAGRTRQEVEEAFEGVDKKVKETGISARDLHKSFGDLVGATDWDKAKVGIGIVADTARSTGLSVDETTEAVIKLQNFFKVAPEQMQPVLGMIEKAETQGRLSAANLVKALGTLGPEAAALGKEGTEGVKEFIAVLQQMSKGLSSPNDALAGMDTLLRMISSKGKTERAFTDYLGMGTVEEDLRKATRDGKSSVLAFMQDIDLTIRAYADKHPGYDPERNKLGILQQLFPGRGEFNRAVAAALSDVNSLRAIEDELAKSKGANEYQNRLKSASESAQADLDRLAAKWEETTTKIGQGLIQAHTLDDLNASIDFVFDKLKGFDAFLEKWIDKSYRFMNPPVEAGKRFGHQLFNPQPGPHPAGRIFGNNALQQQGGGAPQNQQQQQTPASPYGSLVRPVIPSDPGSTTEATQKAELTTLEQIRELLKRGSLGGGSGGGGGGGGWSPGEGGGGLAGSATPGWWTGERQAHAYEVLTKGGISPAGARGLISRWVNVEASGGPGSVNPTSGAAGIAQWLGSRKTAAAHGDFDTQLGHVLEEVHKGTAGAGSEYALTHAQTDVEGAIAASRYERAEHFNPATGADIGTAKTLKGMARVPIMGGHAAPADKHGVTVGPLEVGPQSSLDEQMDDLNALRRKASEPIRTKVAFDFDHYDMQSARYRGGAEARRQFGKQIKLATSRSMTDTGVV